MCTSAMMIYTLRQSLVCPYHLKQWISESPVSTVLLFVVLFQFLKKPILVLLSICHYLYTFEMPHLLSHVGSIYIFWLQQLCFVVSYPPLSPPFHLFSQTLRHISPDKGLWKVITVLGQLCFWFAFKRSRLKVSSLRSSRMQHGEVFFLFESLVLYL